MDITRKYVKQFINEANEDSYDKPPYTPITSADKIEVKSMYGDIVAEVDTKNGYTLSFMCQTPEATGEKDNWYLVLVTGEDGEDLTPNIPEAGPDGHTFEDALNVFYKLLGPKNKSFAQKVANKVRAKVPGESKGSSSSGETVLNGIRIIRNNEVNPFGSAENPAVKKGFYVGLQKKYLNVPAGTILPYKVYYATGKTEDHIYAYDAESNTFTANIKPTYNYRLDDAQDLVNMFYQYTDKISEKQALEYINDAGNHFTGTAKEVLDYISKQDKKARFKVTKL